MYQKSVKGCYHRKNTFVRGTDKPAKAFPTSGISEMALSKKKTDAPKYATKIR